MQNAKLQLKIQNYIIFTVLTLSIVLSISGCSLRKQSDPPSQQTNNETIKQKTSEEYAVLQIDFGDDRIITNYELLNYENQYLWPVMKGVLEKNKVYLDFQDYGGDLGVFIKQIGDKKNGEDGKYWQYLVNGEYAKMGVSSYKLKPKDVILWKFTSSYEL